MTNLLANKDRNITLQGSTPEAFNNAKTSLANFTKLNYIKDDDKLTLTTDASSIAVGLVIHQVTEGQIRTIFLFH